MKKILYIILILFILFQLKIVFDFYSPSQCSNSGNLPLPMPNCGKGFSLQKYLFDANINLIFLPIQIFFNQLVIEIGSLMLKFSR